MKASIAEITCKPIRKFKGYQINKSKIDTCMGLVLSAGKHIVLFFFFITNHNRKVQCETKVSKLTKGVPLSRQFYFVDCSSVLRRSRSVQRASSALALARKITMANRRRKEAEAVAQESGLHSSSSFIPRSPVQRYPYFTYRQKGDCLSSTKVKKATIFIKTVIMITIICKRRSKHEVISRSFTFFCAVHVSCLWFNHEVLREVVRNPSNPIGSGSGRNFQASAGKSEA